MSKQQSSAALSDEQIASLGDVWVELCAMAADRPDGGLLDDETAVTIRRRVRDVLVTPPPEGSDGGAAAWTLAHLLRDPALGGFPAELVCAVLADLCARGAITAGPRATRIRLGVVPMAGARCKGGEHDSRGIHG